MPMSRFNPSEILLVSDMDGTALEHGQPVPTRNAPAIKRFIAAGGQFTFATGRAPGTALYTLEHFPVTLPVITLNGAVAFFPDTGERLIEHTLPGDIFPALLEIAKALSYLAGAMVVTNEEYVGISPTEPGRSLSTYHGIVTPKTYDGLPITSPIYKMLLVAERAEDTDRLRAAASVYEDRFEVVISGERYIELLPKGVSKGNTIRELVERLGLQGKTILTIGDNENDLSMFQVAAVSAAPASARVEIQRAADRVVGPCLEGALADFIDWMLAE